MFNIADRAFELNIGDPSVLSNLAVNVAFGGSCTLDDVTKINENPKPNTNKQCKFHKTAVREGP